MTDDPALSLLNGEMFPVTDGVDVYRRPNIPKDYDTLTLLSDSFREKDFVRAFADAVSVVFDEAIERQRRALSLSRDPDFLSRELRIIVCRMLGMEYNNDILTDDDYYRLIRFLAIYNRQKGPDHFIDFLGYIKDTDFGLVRLWTKTYVDFHLGPNLSEGIILDSPPGPWYPTTHVGILYPDLGGVSSLDVKDVERLFYELAPINLILLWIAAQTILAPSNLYLCSAVVDTEFIPIYVEYRPQTNFIVTSNNVDTDFYLFHT